MEGALRRGFGATFERQGWSVAEAENGRVALRATPGCADIRVVVFSARGLSGDDRARLRDADAAVSAASDPDTVLDELKALVQPHAEGAP